MRGLRDKVSVVVGAAPGNIGGTTALRLAEEGSVTVVADLSIEAAEGVAQQIRDAGGVAVAHPADISSEKSYAALIGFVSGEFGGFDNLFQVAADLSAQTMGVDSESNVVSVPTEVWRRTLDVDLTGYMLGAKLAVPVLLARGGGSIVNTMSAAAWLAEPVRAAYSTAKAGIEALTRHTASAFGQQGIRCNAVAPGLIMTQTASRIIPKDIQDSQLAALPATRLGRPEDIAAMVAFLFSEDAVWINGQTVRVDGGSVMR